MSKEVTLHERELTKYVLELRGKNAKLWAELESIKKALDGSGWDDKHEWKSIKFAYSAIARITNLLEETRDGSV